ncbi:MBOAT-like protein 4 [Elsinoe fawcettii]|nr:MBOAT-like protein 4 [Elsinoe fawcettii]
MDPLAEALYSSLEDYFPAIVPISCLLAAIVFFGLAIHASGISRYLCTVVLTLSALASFSKIDRWPGTSAHVFGLTVLVGLLHAYSVLFLEPETLPYETIRYQLTHEKSPSVSPSAKEVPGPLKFQTKRSRYLKAWSIWNNPRLLNTSRETSHVQPSPASCCRTSFFTHQLLKLAVYFLFTTYLIPLIASLLPLEAGDFSPSHRSLLHLFFSGTRHDLLMRGVFTLLWPLTSFIALDAAHTLMSILFVCLLRLDDAGDWPPLFGDLRDATSIRGFWGRFWPRVISNAGMNIGEVLSQSVLGLWPNGAVERTVATGVVYALSALVHAGVSSKMNGCGWQGDLWFFGMQFLGGLGEMVVVKGWRRWNGDVERRKSVAVLRRGSVPPKKGWGWMDVLGYAWLVVWGFWCVPNWQFGKMEFALREG